jgi:hypothetical protein
MSVQSVENGGFDFFMEQWTEVIFDMVADLEL